MTSLRMRVVEAGARAYEQECHGMADDATWEALKAEYPDDYADMLREMGAALDAALDCLTENADEWANYPAEADPIVVAHREIIARKLLAVLREPTDG